MDFSHLFVYTFFQKKKEYFYASQTIEGWNFHNKEILFTFFVLFTKFFFDLNWNWNLPEFSRSGKEIFHLFYYFRDEIFPHFLFEFEKNVMKKMTRSLKDRWLKKERIKEEFFSFRGYRKESIICKEGLGTHKKDFFCSKVCKIVNYGMILKPQGFLLLTFIVKKKLFSCHIKRKVSCHPRYDTTI